MLIGNQNVHALSQDELTYAALRLAAVDTLMQLDMARDGAGIAEPHGFLREVPFLENVAPVVQVDLIASLWKRHRSSERHQASLLDAAVLYAVFQCVGEIFRDLPQQAHDHLVTGPMTCSLAITPDLPESLTARFESFWGDIDFLTLEQFADVDPKQARRIRKLMGMSNSRVKRLEAVLAQGHASPDILAKLEGLLTDDELQAWSRHVVPPVIVSLRAVVNEIDVPIDGFQAYIHRPTGELFTASDEELGQFDDLGEDEDDAPEWQIEVTRKLRSIRESEDWLELPSKRDFHEWDLMADFCLTVKNDTLREDLLDAIRGSGGFSRFKSMAHRHGLIGDWDCYREQAYSEFVATWLRSKGIAYKK